MISTQLFIYKALSKPLKSTKVLSTSNKYI